MGFILQEIKKKQQQKLPRRGKKQDSWQGLAGQGTTRQEQETFDDELAQDCKHKEIIKGANEEVTREGRWGKLSNNQETRWVWSRQLT